MISAVDVVLSGTFDSTYGYVTIDGTKYTSAQTLTVAKGTSVTVYCSGRGRPDYSSIKLNGTTVAQGTISPGTVPAAEYTFAVTDNCSITVENDGMGSESLFFYYAAITMPA